MSPNLTIETEEFGLDFRELSCLVDYAGRPDKEDWDSNV